ARGLRLHARDERGDLRVGGVAEQRAPRLAVLLDVGQEGVDAAAQPLLAGRAALGRPLEAPEDLGGVRVEQRAVELALGVEVLVDQRLRDAGRVGDVVQRGAVVAAGGERRLGGGEDHRAALGGGHAATAGDGRHGGLRSVAAVVGLGYPAMGVDFAGEGLLDGPGGETRAPPLRLAQRPEAPGPTPGEMRDAVRDGLLVFLLAERLVDGPPRHRMRDVAEAAGVPLELLVALRRANGLPIPDPDAVALTDLDVEAMRTAGAFRDA